MTFIPDKTKFKVPTGQYVYREIFYEKAMSDKSGVVYTLKPFDYAGFPSLYRLYMETDDLTEYTFAVTYLYSWDHWQRLCDTSWFKPYIKAWRQELEIRARSRALNTLRTVASDPSFKDHFQANKLLLSGGWKPPGETKGRGRPSKDEIKAEAERMARDTSDINDDFERISQTSGAVN